MPEERTPAPTGRPTTASVQHPPWWRRHKIVTVAGAVVVIVAAAGTGAALAGGTSNSSHPIPAARAYGSTASVLAAMGRNGVVCSDAGRAGQFTDCSGASDGDTVIGRFKDHADALAYADAMVALGLQLHAPATEVVGPNWVVNTSPAFAGAVITAIGGTIVTLANAQPARSAVPAATSPAAP